MNTVHPCISCQCEQTNNNNNTDGFPRLLYQCEHIDSDKCLNISNKRKKSTDEVLIQFLIHAFLDRMDENSGIVEKDAAPQNLLSQFARFNNDRIRKINENHLIYVEIHLDFSEKVSPAQ